MIQQSLDSASLFDAESLKSRLMGDEELVVQVLEACLPDINANFRDFVEALESGDFSTATQRIHAMKGASQNADLAAVAQLTLRIEDALRAGETKFAEDNVVRLERIVGQTIAEVRRYLNR